MINRQTMLPVLALSCLGLAACGSGSSSGPSAQSSGGSTSTVSTGDSSSSSSSNSSSSIASASSSSSSSSSSSVAPIVSTGGSSSSSTSSSTASSSSSAPASGSTSTAQIVINASQKLASIGAHEIGTNLAIFYNVTTPTLPKEVASVAPTILRWPGGSLAEQYHWQTHTECNQSGSSYVSQPAYDPNSTFDNFMQDIVIPGGYDAAITVAYGTNATCNGPGDPQEAAAWVAYAKQKGYNSQIHYWTVGNETFGGWEVDLHNPPHDGATYAAAMSGPNGYYQLMKAADPTAQIGAFVVGGPGYNNWDATVLKNAQYDFVELHWYAQQPGQESDTWLLNSGPAALTSTINTLRSEMQAAGKPTSTPIMLGEVNSVAYNQGKQTMSIVNALFTGMALGEVLNDNVAITTWWFGAGGSQGCNNNNSSSLYGWQNWGGYDLVAANAAYAWNYCTNNNGPEIVPEGTVFPSGNAFAMVQQFAQGGNSMLGVSVASSLPNIRAYAATLGNGYALMLFNLSETDTTTATVGVSNAAAGQYTGTTITYGKQQYDDSQNNVWTGPVTNSLGVVNSSSLQVTLPPWSMTVVKLQ